jgi:hypothetical protein
MSHTIDEAFAAHKREQARRALGMTMTERLAWLEDVLTELGELQGLARQAGSRRSHDAGR